MSDKSASAIISKCERYRYRLDRQGPGEGSTVVIMVNPADADATEDDQTIAKLRGFGLRNNWGRIIVGNLFAYRSPNVRVLETVDDPIGPENDHHLREMFGIADRVVFAWGALERKLPERLRGRWQDVAHMVPEQLNPLSIGPRLKSGHPRHPCMLAYDLPIQTMEPLTANAVLKSKSMNG